MQIFIFAFVLLCLSSASAFCDEPPAFQELRQKFSTITQLRFKYSERYTPTGVEVGSPPVPMVRNFQASVSATMNEMFITYSSTETGRNWENSGIYVADGKYEWNYQKRGGGHNPSFITKRPVGFQEDLLKKMASSAPQFNKPRPNCFLFEGLFDPDVGSVWSPFQMYEDLKGRTISYDRTNMTDAKGLHHWVVQPEEGCRRVELWIDDKDGTLTKFVSYNPYKGFDERVEYVGTFTDRERNISFASDLFTFDPKKFSDAHVLEMDANKSAEMMVNTFAAPAKLVFESLFEADAATVKDLEGTGSTWFTYNYHLRFTADKLPPLKKQLVFSAGEPGKAIEFFERSFPKDKELLNTASSFELKESHQGKNHFWVLHYPAKKVFFVRAWSDE
ncbi:MAG: hypothetical protein J5J00_11125 [Deltaproteobacteria bacterium]|nr:hypothetical protein [Deltaproteobacteria bacterium]